MGEMAETPRILLVSERMALAGRLRAALGHGGFLPRAVRSLGRSLSMLRSLTPELIVIDLSDSFRSGLETLARLRRHGHDLPVLAVSGETDVRRKAEVLDGGADDYLVVPFDPRELLARVNALLRRARGALSQKRIVRFGQVEVDLTAGTVRRDGVLVHLTPREFALLTCFVNHPGRAQSRDRLLAAAWEATYEGTSRTVDNFVARLRAKFEPNPSSPVHFVTVRATGYRFDS
jgi:DNA-binding response OmpR family regulator